jgi:hypothetical protein
MSDQAGERVQETALSWRRGVALLGATASWAWFLLAGCGGLWLLITMGPWPPTHGWFVLCSGLSLWPVTAWACKKYLSLTLSGRARLGAAALFVLAGRVAVTFLWPWPGPPVNRPDWVAILCGIVLLTIVVSSVPPHARTPWSSRQ